MKSSRNPRRARLIGPAGITCFKAVKDWHRINLKGTKKIEDDQKESCFQNTPRNIRVVKGIQKIQNSSRRHLQRESENEFSMWSQRGILSLLILVEWKTQDKTSLTSGKSEEV